MKVYIVKSIDGVRGAYISKKKAERVAKKERYHEEMSGRLMSTAHVVAMEVE